MPHPRGFILSAKVFFLNFSIYILASLFFPNMAYADLDAGKAKAQTVCQTCHGMNGIATEAMVPNLAGQPKEYLIIQLKDYRSGKRKHERMGIIAGMLTNEDINNLAAWFSAIKVSVQLPQ